MTKNPFVPLLRTRSISFAVSRSWRTRGGCATCVFLHTGMGLVYACLLQLSNGIPRVCMSALQLVAPWNSSSVDMLRTISESIVKSAGSGSTSWSMELPNTRIWVHMDMGAWVVIYGCIYGMGHHMDVGACIC